MKFEEIVCERPDMSDFEEQFNVLLKQFEGSKSVDEQEKALWKINALREAFETGLRVAEINYERDTTNAEFQAEKEFYDQQEPHFKGLVNRFFKALIASPYRPALEHKFGKQLFRLSEMWAQTVGDTILEDLARENALKSEYQKLKAGKIMFRGEEHNLSSLRALKESTDRELRKAALDAESRFMEGHASDYDRIFDALVQLRHGMSTKLGFNNHVEMGYARMTRTDYTPEMVSNYRRQVLEEVVPLVEDLRKAQAKRIGVDPLMAHDVPMLFPDGNPQPKGSEAWIVNHASQMYKELSPETDAFFQHMRQNNMMDLTNRKGKSGGGFCEFLPEQKTPYIFSNFNGTSHDITVLTHEAGHAFQVYSSAHLGLTDLYWPTYESAEIHSMAMEFLTWPWMSLFFEEDTDKFCYEHVAQMLFFLPYGVQVDAFQHYVYENPNATPEERKAHWKALDAQYRPYLQYEGADYYANGGFWQMQSHIYQMPFYYIDYTLAGVCALQFWKRSTADKAAAWTDYLALCKAGGSKSFLELVELGNLASPFADGTLKEVVDHARQWLEQQNF